MVSLATARLASEGFPSPANAATAFGRLLLIVLATTALTTWYAYKREN